MELKRWKRAAFIYPYRHNAEMYNFFPPMGIEVVATAASRIVDTIKIFDLRYEKSIPDLRCYDAVCISVNWHLEARRVAEFISSVPREVLTIVGGREATEQGEKFLVNFPNVDVLVCGDGDETIKELAEGKPFEKIKGIMFRKNGNIVKTEGRAHKEISLLPYPDRRLRRYKYRAEIMGVNFSIPFDIIMTSWGCPYKCKFCALNLDAFGNRRPWSARTPESVIEEMKQISAPWIGIIDENFFVNIKRAEQICDLIIENNLNDKKILVQARIGIAEYPPLLEKMWRAGFRTLFLGIESTCDKTLKLLNKGFTISKVQKALATLRKYQFFLNGYFIVGNFGECEEEIVKIAPFARELGLDAISLNILQYEEKSGIPELLSKYPNYHIAPDGSIYSDNLSRNDLRRIRKSIQRSFYKPYQLVKTINRGIQAGMVSPSRFIGLLPTLSYFTISREIRKRIKPLFFRTGKRK